MIHHADRHHIRRMSEERISRSAGYAFLAQMVGAALTAILTIFLGRSLSAEQFGSLTFALSEAAGKTTIVLTYKVGGYLAGGLDAMAKPADGVAVAIERALTASRPRARYVVGLDAKAQAAAMAMLPQRAKDAAIAVATGTPAKS